MSSAILQLEGVSKRFGGIHAVDGVSFSLREGEIVGLIGPNGAGKTTLVNLITGVHRLTAGAIRFRHENIVGQRPMDSARRGIARTFQIVQPFPDMTVLENVMAGALFGAGTRVLADARAEATAQLAFVGLEAHADKPAAALTLSARKRLELAKSLAMKPKMLLLDEVNAGLNSSEIDGALRLIHKIAEGGITILLIEHLMKVVLSVSRRLLVLHHGRLIADGKPGDIVRDPRVIEAYLGEKFAARLSEFKGNG